MKTLCVIFACCMLLAAVAAAAPIDGKWVMERKMERDGQSFTIKQIFDLKADGNKLTGSVTTIFGEREMKSDLKDGKIDGNKFSFTTVFSGPNGEMKSNWEGSVEGDTIKGTRTGGPGGGDARPFEAKRQ